MDPEDDEIIGELKKLMERHPEIPFVKTALLSVYIERDMDEEIEELQKVISKEHPDYLRGKLNFAHQLILELEMEKALSVLGGVWDLSVTAPDRKVFYMEEAVLFYEIKMMYYLFLRDLEEGEKILQSLETIAPDHPVTVEAAVMMKVANGLTEIGVINEAPNLKFPILKELYCYGPDLPEGIISEILELPRKELIPELEKILVNAVEKYEILKEQVDLDFEYRYFPLHAILLLAELKATEALPKIFSFLSKGFDFSDFWLGDHQTDTLWQAFYMLAFDDPKRLLPFLLEQKADEFNRGAAGDALAQIVFHNPGKTEEVESVFKEALTAPISENWAVDKDTQGFVTMMVENVRDVRFRSLLPVIRQLFEKDYIVLDRIPSLEKVEKEINKKEFPTMSMWEPKGMSEIYREVCSNWYGFDDDFEDEFDDDCLENLDADGCLEDLDADDLIGALERKISMLSDRPSARDEEEASEPSFPKVVRNDPCPCGSGKKYKKCHGKS